MLPNHAPLAIAEQFAMLEALHPGRIDLGIGRAPGTDPMTASAFGRHPHDSVQQFPRDVIDVMGMLGDRRGEGGMWTRFHATPAATRHRSSPCSAPPDTAPSWPACSASRSPTPTTSTPAAPRSPLSSTSTTSRRRRCSIEPYLIVGAGALAAETDEHADYLGLPSRILRYGIRTNHRTPLVHPDAAPDHPDAEAARRMPTEQLIGSTERVVEGLRHLVHRTKADELMVTGATYDVDDRIRSLELISDAWG